MNNNLGQVAGQKALITLINFTEASEALVDKELELVKNNANLARAFCTLSPNGRKESIIYRAIKHLLKISHYYNNKENTEDVVSEALFLLKEASLKFFEENRSINFEQFATVHIRESIKGYLSKTNGLSSSDQNNLIHTAIKIIKKKTDNCRLSYDQAKHLAKCYNLCEKNGYKKIWRLESLHFDKISLWQKVTNEDGGEEEICIADKKQIDLYDNSFQNDFNDPAILFDEIENQKELDKNKIILNNFNKSLNKTNEKIIFEKRLYCVSENPLKLKDLAKLLSISLQRVSTIENNIKKKLKNFYTVENKIITDIK